jgi:hypothetical protein
MNDIIRVGSLVRDHDYGMNGIVVGDEWTFLDNDDQMHMWEFRVLLESGEVVGSDTFSLTLMA